MERHYILTAGRLRTGIGKILDRLPKDRQGEVKDAADCLQWLAQVLDLVPADQVLLAVNKNLVRSKNGSGEPCCGVCTDE